MKELIPIREWLLNQKGNWSAISARTQLSTKTIQRIASDPDRFVNMRTFTKLRDEMARNNRRAA